ncbi:MAG: DUF2203 domain-containing protein [Longimicrobiales bacterium]|nr:DUF2203 domain-containing protein [Longimicrobiales bacterium]
MTALPPGLADVRFFDLDEANRQLPLVRRIVEDILEHHAAGDDDEVEALVEELHDLGCYFKGFQEGLVDWYSYYAGRPVFLCWKLGEPEIAYWHQTDAGFRGRQPILPGQRDAFRAEPPGKPAGSDG